MDAADQVVHLCGGGGGLADWRRRRRLYEELHALFPLNDQVVLLIHICV